MKKTFMLILLVLLSMAGYMVKASQAPITPTEAAQVTSSPSPTNTQEAACTITALETLNLRAAAGTSSAVIAILENGETVTILPQPTQGDWIPVRAGGLDGWINSKYCKVIP